MAMWGHEPQYTVPKVEKKPEPIVHIISDTDEMTKECISAKDRHINTLTTRIQDLERELKELKVPAKQDYFSKYGGEGIVRCATEAATSYYDEYIKPPVYDGGISNIFYNESVCSNAPTKPEKQEAINPMECFIILLQEENILDLFVDAQCTDFEELADEWLPRHYVEVGLTGEIDETIVGWGAVNDKWLNVVKNLNLDDHAEEAVYE